MSTSLLPLISCCCDGFRLGREAEASALFDQVLAEVTTLIEGNPQLMTEPLQRSFALSLACQQRHDWIGLADEVEFVLVEHLQLRD